MNATATRRKKKPKQVDLASLGISPEQAAEFVRVASIGEDLFQVALECACWPNPDDDRTPKEIFNATVGKAVFGSGNRPDASCGASPTKHGRRTKAEVSAIRAAMYDLLDDERPMTVRQVFYRLVSKGIIAKTEGEYNSTVCRLLSLMRRDGTIPFDWIADSTRWMRKPRTYSGLQSMLESTARTYRRDLWANQDAYVEIWLEKEALAGVLYDVTAEWDVPLMVTRGYPSLSYLYSAAEAIQAEEKPAFLYYFGDHDPSGLDIPRKVEADLRTFAPEADLHFERVAVTMEQVDQWDLQTRPTKKTDTRAKGFEGESVEVDAIPPDELRQLVRDCIEQHVDPDVLRRTQRVEAAERETLQGIIERMEGDAA